MYHLAEEISIMATFPFTLNDLGTSNAWEREEARRDASEAAELADQARMCMVPHTLTPDPMLPGYCKACGVHVSDHI